MMVPNEHPSADALAWAALLPLLPNLESYTLRLTRDSAELPLHLLQPLSNSLLRCPNICQARWMFIVHPLALPVVMQVKNLRSVHFGQLAVRSMSLVGQYLKEMPKIEEPVR
ncbi:hypothetical protein FA95DRAFT_1562588 [Auriscalpium vulgare]|uniref:Uncharacterized protein n=1 Tax=Auriscalpium vulgare TaxID=40419 RepID=A0ACB8RKQ8_9AGAM|nr:hypothetical protein FA95DRAFT_1562588 [Auriscalpium vulgare]